MSSSYSADGLCGDVFFLDEFALRQWDDPAYGGTRCEGADKVGRGRCRLNSG